MKKLSDYALLGIICSMALYCGALQRRTMIPPVMADSGVDSGICDCPEPKPYYKTQIYEMEATEDGTALITLENFNANGMPNIQVWEQYTYEADPNRTNWRKTNVNFLIYTTAPDWDPDMAVPALWVDNSNRNYVIRRRIVITSRNTD
jgi:hypothetical protein